MNIFYLANVRMPTEKAHGIQIIKMCEAFGRAGHNVKLLAPRRFNPIKESPFFYYGVEKNFEIVKLPCLDFVNAHLGKIGFWIQIATFYIAAKIYLLGKKIDCLYTRDFLPAIIMPWRRRVIFYEIHALPKGGLFFHKIAWNKSKGLIVISEGIKEGLLAYGLPEKKIFVARDAVDLEKFDIGASKNECRAKLNLSQNRKMVLYIGHLYKWKGADLLAQAAKFLGDNADVYLVGGTAADAEIFRKNYPFPNLRIIGWQHQRFMPFWLKAADILVLPTSGREEIGRRYTSPLKLFEYMASGTPIIAADLPSIKEVLSEEEAVFFAADDASSLAKKITESLGRMSELVAAARSARNKARLYSWDKRSEAVGEFIRQALEAD